MSSVIDQNVLNSLLDSVGGDLEFLGELIETLYEDTPEQFQAMDTALESGDAETFRRAAHSLKSNSSSFGAMHLSEICKKLEEMGKSGDLSEASPLLTESKEEYKEVVAALNAVLNQ